MKIDQIQAYQEPASGQDIMLAPAENIQGPDNGVPEIVLLKTLQRRWLTILLVWALVVGIFVPYVWITKRLTYTATAQVQIVASVPRILFEDENTRVMPFFSQYLNTQEHLIESRKVLEAALNHPEAQGLPLLEIQDPVSALRRSLEVEEIQGTHLLEMGVTDVEKETAIRLTRAVVDAYMTSVVQAEAEEQKKKRKILEEERAQVKAKLDAQKRQIHELASTYGTATDTILDLLRQGIVESSLETKRELERTKLEIIQLNDRLKQLKETGATEVAAEDSVADRQKAINEDPMVRSLQEQLLKVSEQLVRLKTVLTPDNPQFKAVGRKKELLEKELAKERVRAAEKAKENEVELQQMLAKEQEATLKQKLKAAERRQEALEQLIHSHEKEGMALGQVGLQIKALQEKSENTENNLRRIDERIRQLDIESQRPARVTVASPPEIRPDGIRDSRMKWTVMGIGGGLFLAIFAGLLKDRLDPNLRSPREVENSMGIPLLGSVPRLSELKSGRVTQEDFVESYRMVRASLAGLSADKSPPRTILITSAHAGEAKTSLAVGLASSLAEPGQRVLLIDGDLQAPIIGKLLKVHPLDGLAAALRGDRTLTEAILRSPLKGVDVLATDSNGIYVRQYLNNSNVEQIIKESSAMYDYVVVDSPPVLGSADALFWAQNVEGVVVSSLAGQSDTAAMRLAYQRLRTVDAKILGAVVGNVSLKDSYYSTSGYRYKDYGAKKMRNNGSGYVLMFPSLPGDGSSKTVKDV